MFSAHPHKRATSPPRSLLRARSPQRFEATTLSLNGSSETAPTTRNKAVPAVATPSPSGMHIGMPGGLTAISAAPGSLEEQYQLRQQDREQFQQYVAAMQQRHTQEMQQAQQAHRQAVAEMFSSHKRDMQTLVEKYEQIISDMRSTKAIIESVERSTNANLGSVPLPPPNSQSQMHKNVTHQ
jgi:uncharacterized membrane protein